jgi:hypothetical protein
MIPKQSEISRRDWEQWDVVISSFQTMLETPNGGYLGPMLELANELCATPPASHLIPGTSHESLVVSRLSHQVFPQPHVWACLQPSTGLIEVGYSKGQPNIDVLYHYDQSDIRVIAAAFQRLAGKLLSEEGDHEQ